jgi:FkbM family methyltransferase
MSWRHFVKTTLKKFDVGISRYGTLEQLREDAKARIGLDLLLTLPPHHSARLLGHLADSRSQLGQDLFVLSELDFKREGYFVEFGATNGTTLSNTHLLEKQFGWTGILAEPARCWHSDLKKNRSAIIETNCVWRDSTSVLNFNEVSNAELSTINLFSSSDIHRTARIKGHRYCVKTISMNDLLAKHNAPKQIDFLSIDTEGSELEILRAFDFDHYHFRVITCEHNFTSMREEIFALLSVNGYVRKYQEISKFDDWYVKVGET